MGIERAGRGGFGVKMREMAASLPGGIWMAARAISAQSGVQFRVSGWRFGGGEV